jgi:hypothetical protein
VPAVEPARRQTEDGRPGATGRDRPGSTGPSSSPSSRSPLRVPEPRPGPSGASAPRVPAPADALSDRRLPLVPSPLRHGGWCPGDVCRSSAAVSSVRRPQVSTSVTDCAGTGGTPDVSIRNGSRADRSSGGRAGRGGVRPPFAPRDRRLLTVHPDSRRARVALASSETCPDAPPTTGRSALPPGPRPIRAAPTSSGCRPVPAAATSRSRRQPGDPSRDLLAQGCHRGLAEGDLPMTRRNYCGEASRRPCDATTDRQLRRATPGRSWFSR